MRAPRLLGPVLLPLLLLLLAPACGVDEGKGLALVEGANINDATGCYPDGTCPYVDDFCVVIEFDEYDLPPRCLPVNICNRFTCTEGECRAFTGRPGSVKCVIP